MKTPKIEQEIKKKKKKIFLFVQQKLLNLPPEYGKKNKKSKK